MRLRRALDEWYDRGFADGQRAKPPNPTMPQSDARYLRMAYDAGYEAGLKDMRATYDRLFVELDRRQRADAAQE